MTRLRNAATPAATAIISRRMKVSSALNPTAAFFQPFHMAPLSTEKRPWLQNADLRLTGPLNAGRASATIARSLTSGEAAMTGFGRKIVYVVLVVVVLLVIWQFLASL